MPTTSAERRALAVIASIAALGAAVRVVRAKEARPAPTAAETIALDAQIARVRAAREKPPRKSGRASRAETATGGRSTVSQGPGDTTWVLVDLDTASAFTIEALPWIGASLAARIIESRERCGPFGSLDALKRVYGIGDGMTKRLEPYVTFSTPSRPNGADLATCDRSAKGAAPRRRGRS